MPHCPVCGAYMRRVKVEINDEIKVKRVHYKCPNCGEEATVDYPIY